MSEQPKPEHGNQPGPCAICGSYAYPKYGHFLCPQHATLKHAKRADEKAE